MKIIQLLEAQFSKPIYAYHATKSKYIKSILKQGLIPNLRPAGYGSSEKSGMGYKLTPLSGIYLTDDADDAISIAKSYLDNSSIIVCKVQKKQVDLDEDHIIFHLIPEHELARDIRLYFDVRNNSQRNDYYTDIKNDPQKTNKKIEEFAKHYVSTKIVKKLTRYMNDKDIQNATKALEEYIVAVTIYYFSIHEEDSEIERKIVSNIKQTQNVITKKLKKILSLTGEHRFKLDAPISFSGSNRIVGIYNVENRIGWGDIGDLKPLAYHIVKSPIELFKYSV